MSSQYCSLFGRLWSYARDDRPWQGPLPPAVAYVYSQNRQGAHPQSHPAAFAGVLQGRRRRLSSGRPQAGPGGRVQCTRANIVYCGFVFIMHKGR